MAETNKPMSFKVEPIDIEVGSENTKITIKDLSLEAEHNLYRKIGKIMFDKAAIPVAAKGMSSVIQRRMLEEKMSAEDATAEFIENLSELYTNLNTSDVNELLKVVTDNQITDDIIKTMGSQERKNMLMFLLDRQFAALKNLHASLSTILSPTTIPAGKQRGARPISMNCF